MLVINSRHGDTMMTIIVHLLLFQNKLVLLEAKAGESWVWGQLQLHQDVQVSVGYTARPYLQTFFPKSWGTCMALLKRELSPTCAQWWSISIPSSSTHTAPRWTIPRGQSACERINKARCAHTVEYHSVGRRKQLLILGWISDSLCSMGEVTREGEENVICMFYLKL